MHVMSASMYVCTYVCICVCACVYACMHARERKRDATEVTCDFLLFYSFFYPIFLVFLFYTLCAYRASLLFIHFPEENARQSQPRDCLPHDFVA